MKLKMLCSGHRLRQPPDCFYGVKRTYQPSNLSPEFLQTYLKQHSFTVHNNQQPVF